MSDRKSKEPTGVQKRLLKFVQAFIDEHGYGPSHRDVMAHVKISSTSMVNFHYKKLENMEYIEREPNVARSVRVIKPLPDQHQDGAATICRTDQEMLSVPVVGRIFASQPVHIPPSTFNYFEAEKTVDLAPSMLKVRSMYYNQVFALEVKGESMIDDMVNDGDFIILQTGQYIHNGDMVAVWLHDENETTLKRYYDEGNRIRLEPANPRMEPIYIENDREIEIQGKVLLIIKTT